MLKYELKQIKSNVMINTIVFDFGGVLIDWNPKYVYQSMFNDDAKMDWFLSNVCTNDWNLEQDRGRSFAEGTAILRKDFPEYSDYIDTFHSKWEQMVKGEILETVMILKELKRTYKIYGLTNWSAETFPIALNRFDFLQLFDGIVVSGEEKMIKPDKQFFQLLLNRYKLKAAECIFIDDNRKNIEAAYELGFNVIHFSSPENLRAELKARKILK